MREKLWRNLDMALNKGLSIDNSYVDAIVMAHGISYGGSCLGFEYDFDKCIKALDIVYDSYKRK